MDREIDDEASTSEDELITLGRAARLVGRSPLTLAARAVDPPPGDTPRLCTLLLGADRYTTLRWVRAFLAGAAPVGSGLDLDALIARVADDPAFWSYVLVRWMAAESLDGQAAIRRLGIRRPLDIMLLAGLSCPYPGSEDADALVAFCARYCHADVARLHAVLVRYKRLPGSPDTASMLEDALRHGDDAFMARPLVRWQALHDADDRTLGAYLGMPPGRLGLLAYYPRPEPGAASYPGGVRFLARQSGCDAAHLDALLREGAATGGRCHARVAGTSAGRHHLPAGDPGPVAPGAAHGR